MPGADPVVVQHSGFILRQHHNPACPLGKPLEHAPRLSHSRPTTCPTPIRYIAMAVPAEAVQRGVTDLVQDDTQRKVNAGLATRDLARGGPPKGGAESHRVRSHNIQCPALVWGDAHTPAYGVNPAEW